MTKREAAIVSAYTGYLIGKFHDMHVYVEEIIGRPVFTHEMANEKFMNELRDKTKKDFCSIEVK